MLSFLSRDYDLMSFASCWFLFWHDRDAVFFFSDRVYLFIFAGFLVMCSNAGCENMNQNELRPRRSM